MARKKNIETHDDQKRLFSESMLRGEIPGHFIDQMDLTPFGDTYLNHYEKIRNKIISFTGPDSEMSAFEVYERMFCLDSQDEDIGNDPTVPSRSKIQKCMESPFTEGTDGKNHRTFGSNPVVYARSSLELPKSGRYYILFSDTFRTRLAELQKKEFAIISGCTYLGRKNTLAMAQKMYAMIFDIDGVTDQTVHTLFVQMDLEEIPRPNVMVQSGQGIHLMYFFRDPILIYTDEMREWLKWVKRTLTYSLLWTKFTSTDPKPQYQGITQGYRLVGSPTKIRGINVRAYRCRHDKYTLEELESYITEADEHNMRENFSWVVKPNRPDSKPRVPLEEAKEKWPEWWNRVEERKKTGLITEDAGTYTCNRTLYDWWLSKLNSHGNVRYGHRYYCIFLLGVYAAKCAILYDEYKRDAEALQPRLDAIGFPLYPFTEEDLEAALKGYYAKGAKRYSLKTISFLSGIPVEKNKHPFLDAYNESQKRYAERSGKTYVPEKMTRERWLEVRGRALSAEARRVYGTDWRKGGGNQSCIPKLRAWIEAHPYGTQKEASEDPELGLSFSAVSKNWSKAGGIPRAERVERWYSENPDATPDECAQALGISLRSASDHWKKSAKTS